MKTIDLRQPCAWCGCNRWGHLGKKHSGSCLHCDCVRFRTTGPSRREAYAAAAKMKCEATGHVLHPGDTYCDRCAVKVESPTKPQ